MANKPTNVRITSISAGTSSVGSKGSVVSQVFGLGNDEQVYYWDSMNHQWVLYAS